ncbi:hypothetical protein [Parasphingorhabdus sp.]|uniref:hypothetical protein n=1 Tax=Parasphingorhabdus sp. TaxID=2709688 RepID=UPI003A9106FA
MTKQEIGGAEILSSLKPLSYPGDSNFDIFAERRKSVYNRPILERSWSKQYLDGVLQVACVFKAVPDKEGVVFSSHDQNSGIGFDNVGFGVRRYTGHQIPITIKNQEFFSGFESKPAERRDEYLVLILDVEFVQIIKIVAPPLRTAAILRRCI